MIYDSVSRFGITDYTIFSVILFMTITVGIYFSFSRGKTHDLLEYFVGSRRMGILPVAMSLVATFQSPVTVLGTTTEIYLFGAAAWYRICGAIVAAPIIAHCFLPVFYNAQLTSVFEYLERRFNSTLVRKVGSFIAIVQLTILTSFMLYGSSLILAQVTGSNLWLSVVITNIIATFYTALGGIRAVMWTDVVQVIIIFLSVLTCTIQGTIDDGGAGYVINKAWNDGLMNISTDFDLRVRYTIWNVTIPALLNAVAVAGIGQMYVQRFVSAPTLQKARKSLYIYTLSNVFFSILILLAGLVIYAEYHNCDPLLTKNINRADQLLVLFVMKTLHIYPGLRGLFVGGLFCAALSSISSILNSISALVFEDFLKKLPRFNTTSSPKATTISKIITVIFSIVALIFVSALDNLGTIFRTFFYTMNVFAGSLLGIFSLGLFVPWANSFGAIIGSLTGTIFSQWVSVVSQMHPPYTKRFPGSVTECTLNETFRLNINNTRSFSSAANASQSDIFPLYQVAFSWIIVFSFVPVIVFGMIFSAIYRPTTTTDVDVQLIVPAIRQFLTTPRTNDQVKSDFM